MPQRITGFTTNVSKAKSGSDWETTVYKTKALSNPPTEAEIKSIFGNANQAETGYIGILEHTGAPKRVYLITPVGNKWFYIAGTVAV